MSHPLSRVTRSHDDLSDHALAIHAHKRASGARSRWAFALSLILICLFSVCALSSCGGADQSTSSSTVKAGMVSEAVQSDEDSFVEPTVQEDGVYSSKEEVAAYLNEYGHLPSNFISKRDARQAGWRSSAGNLDEVLPGYSIGGDVFHNDDGTLPDAEGRRWSECDINYEGGYRGAERIVFSNDGLIYYTGDHYQSFERLY